VNRLFLKYRYEATAVILLIFAWVVAQRLSRGPDAIIPLAVAAIVVWPVGVLVFTYSWPRITVEGFRRAIVRRGFGGGPIPVNSLYAVPERPSRSATSGSLMAVGTDDLVYIGGWLDLKAGPRVLHVPEMDGRYYSVQLTDPTGGPAATDPVAGQIDLVNETTQPIRPDLLALFEKEELVKYLAEEELYE